MSTLTKTILCIEDNPEASALIAEDLQKRGYRVSIAVDGNAGLAAILKTPPALVLCAVNLPGMTGFELLESLNDVAPHFKRVPFIFLTAMSERGGEMSGRWLGADDYVTKPIDLERLAAIIEARVGRPHRYEAWWSHG